MGETFEQLPPLQYGEIAVQSVSAPVAEEFSQGSETLPPPKGSKSLTAAKPAAGAAMSATPQTDGAQPALAASPVPTSMLSVPARIGRTKEPHTQPPETHIVEHGSITVPIKPAVAQSQAMAIGRDIANPTRSDFYDTNVQGGKQRLLDSGERPPMASEQVIAAVSSPQQ